MSYSKIQFGKDLKEKILLDKSLLDISEWASAISYQYEGKFGDNFDRILHYLEAMSFGPQHEISHERLNSIAEDLILGIDVDIRSSKYRKA